MKYIILDRDGVINYDSYEYIKSPDEWIPIPGSLDAIADLNRAGYHVLVATNQSGIARGYYDYETLDQIHEKMQYELAQVGGVIDEIFFCPHHPDEKCSCRKPEPGLFHQMQKKYQLDFSDIYFVGDNFSDVQVANTIGCKPLLVLTGKTGEKVVEENPSLKSVTTFSNLATAVQYILKS